MRFRDVDWRGLGKTAIAEFQRDDVPGLAAGMAYHFIFALFPFVIFLAALAGLVGRAIGNGALFDSIMNYLYSNVPTAASALKEPLDQVLNQQRGGALSLGAVLALWSASNGVRTLMKAFNRAYGIDDNRNFFLKAALSIALTVAISLLLIVGFVLLIFGGNIGAALARYLGLGGIFPVAWNVARFVIVIVGIWLALSLLFWRAPDLRHEFRFLTPGPVFSTLAWLVFTILFGVYVQYLGNSSYSKTYGTAYAIVLFLFYLYLSSIMILLGAELNAEAARRYAPGPLKDRVTDPHKQRLSRREGDDAAAAGQSTPALPTDPSASEERLRAIRERPFILAAERARLAQERLSPAERARRARAALAAVGVSTAAAVGGVVVGSLRRRPPR
ncbi:MAG TPA: YihY/virulence factor BrkB family protein [Thermomicrobiales bacterium]|nr:YihY/virulence factor BrkB family protein [Thermomicrobiales bacterium]